MSAKAKQTRLTAVYNTAETIPFTNEDRFVFFSDVHRGDNSWADEFARNELIYSHALQHYYDAGFTYIEVGDGDELMKFRFVETIRIAHEQVYRQLQKFHQEGRLQYIYGNHDIEYGNPNSLTNQLNQLFNPYTDTSEILFNDFRVHEGLRLVHQESGVEFFVTHGHQGEFWSDKFAGVSSMLLYRLWRPLQLLGFQDPTSIAKNPRQRQKVELQLIDWVVKNQQPLICGHTHDERFPNGDNHPPYFNIGSCVHPRWITSIEINNGQIALVRWRIKARKKGDLFVKHKVIAGPTEIGVFSQAAAEAAPAIQPGLSMKAGH
ncbi:MAG: serine/threonine protein phosphatase [Anaerolineae bacterium]|jgi:UDP-2,3-diacylglucosamine pyrophosphatase LpxH|nr:serine/threonine protein phosphatase [Anaerolineae bacterium]